MILDTNSLSAFYVIFTVSPILDSCSTFRNARRSWQKGTDQN